MIFNTHFMTSNCKNRILVCSRLSQSLPGLTWLMLKYGTLLAQFYNISVINISLKLCGPNWSVEKCCFHKLLYFILYIVMYKTNLQVQQKKERKNNLEWNRCITASLKSKILKNEWPIFFSQFLILHLSIIRKKCSL